MPVNGIRPPNVVVNGRRTSGEELAERALGWADVIAERAPRRGGPVAGVLTNDADSVALFFALASLDRPFVTLPPEPREWGTHIASTSVPVFVPPRLRDAFDHESIQASIVKLEHRHGTTARSAAAYEIRAPGLAMLTSGSTGEPKPIFKKIHDLVRPGLTRARALGLERGVRTLTALPISRAGGIIGPVLTTAALDGTLTLCDPADFRGLCQAFADGPHDYWPTAAVMIEAIVRAFESTEEPVAAPRVCRIAGWTPQPLFDRFRTRTGGVIRSTYGSTETGTLTCDYAPENEVRAGGAGWPIEGAEIAIGDSPEDTVPQGSTGSLWVRSPWIAHGYGLTPSSMSVSANTWWRTPDVGRIERDGSLTLQGRSDDIVRDGRGQLVNLVELAHLAASHPDVTQAVAVCVGSDSGNEVGLVVEACGAHTVRDMLEHLSQAIGAANTPRRVLVVHEVPRLTNGKIDRVMCAKLLAQ